MLNRYIQEHGKRLYGLCMTLCRNVPDAEDLYQDMWLKIMANLDKYDTSLPFEPWAAQVCVNLYRNRLRRLTRSPIFNGFSSTEDKDTALESIPAKEQADYTDLHAAIDRLPEKLRLVIILFYFEDMDQHSVARVLQMRCCCEGGIYGVPAVRRASSCSLPAVQRASSCSLPAVQPASGAGVEGVSEMCGFPGDSFL